MSNAAIFTTDERYDRIHASDFQSRYGAYLRRNVALFLDVDDKPTSDPLEFAAMAWRVAQSPVMSPPYVLAHRRVLESSAALSYDGRLAVTVNVSAKAPREVARSLSGRLIKQERDQATASAVLRFRVPISAGLLPVPEYSARAEPDVDAAKAAIRSICERLNASLAKVFGQHEGVA